MQVPKKELLRVEVFDNDPIDPDDSLGIVEIDIEQEVATAPRCTVNKRFFLQEARSSQLFAFKQYQTLCGSF